MLNPNPCSTAPTITSHPSHPPSGGPGAARRAQPVHTWRGAQAPGADDELGGAAGAWMARRTGGGASLAATVVSTSRAVPATKDADPVPFTTHVVLRPKAADANGESSSRCPSLFFRSLAAARAASRLVWVAHVHGSSPRERQLAARRK